MRHSSGGGPGEAWTVRGCDVGGERPVPPGLLPSAPAGEGRGEGGTGGGRRAKRGRCRGRRGAGLGVWWLFPAVTLWPGGGLGGQGIRQDLVVTWGVAAEGYRGNLAAVTIPAVDSTTRAEAVAGEVGVRGTLRLLSGATRRMDLSFDGGLRQSAAAGFKVRDYAPREWVGEVELHALEEVASLGTLWAGVRWGGRRVDDRPPMPLFLQPGYWSLDGRLGVATSPRPGLSLEGELYGEWSDFSTSPLTPQLDLLDRKGAGLQMGARWGAPWTMGVWLEVRGVRYDKQGTFDPSDPFRRDRALVLAGEWASPRDASVLVRVRAEGTLNRSNSRRPEYDALRLEGVAYLPLPHLAALNVFGAYTTKRYLTPTGFARLVPGEEADNASQIYLELQRPLLLNLDGALRVGWTRAETEIGGAYFRRSSVALLVRYRPWEK